MILVTGGTGSLGRAYIARHLDQRIRVISRDEEKQRAMALDFPDVDYVIGDVRDREAVRRAMVGVDRVLHAAALKQVPPLEAAPREAVRTNILGTENVCAEAWESGIARVVTVSTDKAVEPIGVMGASKMLAEAITTAWGFDAVRYGNVIGSRGSIVPVWREAIRKGQPIRITDPEMTRFLITLDEALDLIDLAFCEGGASIWVRKSPAATVGQLARVIGEGHPTITTGIRPGEKRHESLVVPDEHVEDCGDHYRIRRGQPPAGLRYSSEDAPRLTDDVLWSLIAQAPAA